MLEKCTLIICPPGGRGTYSIRATNFPEILPGSLVDIELEQDITLEKIVIDSFEASTTWGAIVHFFVNDKDFPPQEKLDKVFSIWKTEQGLGRTEYLYNGVVDFSCWW